MLVLAGCGGKSTQAPAAAGKPANATTFASVTTQVGYADEVYPGGIQIKEPQFTISEFMFDTSRGITVPEEELKSILAAFDVPVTMTERVQYYVKYFTSNGRASMQAWIDRSNQYMYIVRDIFRKEDVPQDLVVLSFTESGFNPLARSRAGAMGMWQFMKGTGNMYGLKVNEWVDERKDFEKSTTAAARHLNDLYEMFDDWYLAMAAYNAGSGKISKATKTHKSNDFFVIATGRTLKLETRDYVPKYLAQLIIYKNMMDYGFTPPSEFPLLYDKVEVNEPVNIFVVAEVLGCSYADMKKLNPELLTPMTPPSGTYALRIPAGNKDTLLAHIANKDDLARYVVHKARAGDSLARIAKQYGTTAAAIKKINSYNYDQVYTAKTLFIPKSSNVSSEADNAFAKEIATLAPKYYTVRKGDNMTIISRKHNMPLNVLVQLNPTVKPSKIYPGQVLVISRGGL